MSTPPKSTDSAAALRQRAEVAFRETAAAAPDASLPLSLEATQALLHELQVHQIELEMQNEELRRTQAELEVSRASYFDFYNLAPVGYCTVSETGLILEANRNLATWLGVALGGSPDALLTQRFAHFIFKEDQDIFYFLRHRLLASGQPQACELRMNPPAGPHFWVQLAAIAFPQADGATGLRLVLSDITAAKQAAAALRESHDLFARFIQHSPIHAYIKTATPTASRVLKASDSFQQMLGRTGAELVGKSMAELFPADLAAQITADDWAVATKGKVLKREEDLNGRHYATIKFPIVQGGEILVGGYTVDITDLKQSEVALRESEARFRKEQIFNQLLLDTSPALIVAIGSDGKTLMMNQALLDILEYAAAEVRGTDYLTTFVPPEDRRLLAETFQRVTQEKAVVITTNRILSKSGQTYLVEWHGRKAVAEAADLGFFVGVGINITVRQQAEAAVLERRKELDCIYGITALGQEVHSLEEMFRGSVELLPQGWHYPEVAAARILWQGRSYQTGNFRETEWRQSRDLKLAGQPVGRIDLCYLEARPRQAEGPFLTEERELLNAVAIKLERFAERQQAEALLRASEGRYRSLFDRANDGITLISPEGELLELNESFARMHGQRPDEMRRLKLTDLDTPQTLGAVPERMRRLLAGEALTFEVEHHHKEGRVVPLEVSASLISVTGQPVVLCFHRDITERRGAEEALRASEERFRIAAESANDVVYEWDLKQSLQWFGKIDELLGYPPGGFPRTLADWAAAVHPEDFERTMAAVQAHLEGRAAFVMEYRVRRKDGVYRWWVARGAAARTPEGKPLRMIGSITDITERRQVEEKLRVSLEEKTTLLKEVHHRVKNNLQLVASLLNLQAGRVENAEVLDLLAVTRNRVSSMALLHEHLYQAENFAQLDLAQYVHSLCSHLLHAAGPATARVRIEQQIAREKMSLGLDQAVPLGLLLNELLTNAFKHAFPGERAGLIRVTLELPTPQELLLTVADDGIGLPATLDPRQTRSLGLKLIFLLTQQLDGTVNFEREPGTVVQVRFPNPEKTETPS